jgi:hypothetical protein
LLQSLSSLAASELGVWHRGKANMPKQWNDEKFAEWLSLRGQFKDAKRAKNYDQTIKIGLSILDLAKAAKFIEIMTPLFHRDLGDAYSKSGNTIKALEHYREARSEFIEYRKTQRLSKPSDWLRDIDTLDKKIGKIDGIINNK